MLKSHSFGKRPRATPPRPIRHGYDNRPWLAAFNPTRPLASEQETRQAAKLGAIAASCLFILVLLGVAIVPVTQAPSVALVLKAGCAALIGFSGWRVYLVQSPWASGVIVLSAAVDLAGRIALPGGFVQQYPADLVVAFAILIIAAVSLRGALALRRRQTLPA